MQPASQEQPSKATEQTALEDCLLTLLRGIQKHSVIADGAGAQEFRAELAALESRLNGKDNAAQLVGSAVEILDKYGTQANQALAQQQSGLVAAAERWTAVEEQIKAISRDDDLDAVKAHLTAQIVSARTETLQAASAIRTLGTGPTPGQATRIAATVDIPDQLTGLPARPSAETELRRVHGDSADRFLALFVVKRLALINAKFGYSRGDQVLRKVVVHLTQALPDYNVLFRWAPCAFLTLAPPNTTYKELRGKVQLIELARLTPTLEWEGRSAMVPVAIDCRILPVKDFGTLPDLFLRLDTLAADA